MTHRLPTVGADSNAWGALLNQWLTDNVGYRIYAADYGALGNGSDDTTALQNALNAVDTLGNDRGTTIVLPRGTYSTSALTYAAAAPLRICGDVASMGNITGTTGVTLMPRANSQTILTIGDGSTVYQEGAVLDNINFYANSFTGCTGLKVTGVNHWGGDRLGFKDLAIGLEQRASPTTDNAWAMLRDSMFWGSTTAGLKTYDAFGLVVEGGGFFVPDGSGTVYGMWLTGGAGEASQSIKVYSTFFDGMNHPGTGSAIGMYFERAHECLASGVKFEQLDIGADFTADTGDSGAGAANTLAFCTWSADAADIGVRAQANASSTHLIVPSMTSVGTGISNASSRLKVFGGRLDVTTPWTGTQPEFIGTDMPDGGSGRFSQTVLGGGSSGDKLGFYGHTPSTKLAVTGSRGGNAALASLLTQLAAYGLITDSSS